MFTRLTEFGKWWWSEIQAGAAEARTRAKPTGPAGAQESFTMQTLLRYLEAAAAAISWFFAALVISQYYNEMLFPETVVPAFILITTIKVIGIFSIPIFFALIWWRGLKQWVPSVGLDMFLYIGAFFLFLFFASLLGAGSRGYLLPQQIGAASVYAGAGLLSLGLYGLCYAHSPAIAAEKRRARQLGKSIAGYAFTGSLRLLGVIFALWLVFDPQGIKSIFHETAIDPEVTDELSRLLAQRLDDWIAPVGIHFVGWVLFGLLIRSLFFTVQQLGDGDARSGLRRWAVAFGMIMGGLITLIAAGEALNNRAVEEIRLTSAIVAVVAAGLMLVAIRTYRADRASGRYIYPEKWT